MCTQRPTGISRFCFTESEYVYLLFLTDERDKKTVKEFVPFDISKPLPEYHGYWYDSPRNKQFIMRPVPSEERILDAFHEKLGAKRHVY